MNKTVYVAFVDFTNAFPSTDHSTLWLKLCRLGVGGAIFDWIQFIYQDMDYYVRHGDQETTEFKVLIGLLTGDPLSPIFWNLFMADLRTPLDYHDAVLIGIAISLMAQADDLLLVSLAVEGLQQKLNSVEKWCSSNFIIISAVKTAIMAFGRLPSPPTSIRNWSKHFEYQS